MTSSGTTIEQPWYRGGAFHLLVLIILVYGIGAFVGTDGVGAQVINLLTVGLVLLALKQISDSRKVFLRAIALLVGLLVASGVVHLIVDADTYVIDTVVVLIFFVFIVGALFKVVMRRERITADKIFAACCVYILLGICWGFLFVLIHYFDPAAFSLAESDLAEPSEALIHFSFTTLTTVGYGNISPLSGTARSLSDLEAVLAQLYLAVVVARLVALQLTHSSSDQPS